MPPPTPETGSERADAGERDVHHLDLLDHQRFGAGYPFDDWARLRAEAPVCPMSTPGWEPYWAVTTPEVIREVSSHPERFLSAPTLRVLADDEAPEHPFRSVINMDPPEHGRYRRIVADRFTRRWVEGWRPRLRQLADDLLDRTWVDPPQARCDFAADIAEWFPFHVIAELLGIPEADHVRVLEYLNLSLLGGLPEFMDYMRDLALERRHSPGDDLGSVLSTARIDGELLEETELVSYYCTLASAAHGTVRNALAGAVLAFAEHPDQYERLCADPGLVPSAVEEVLRWTTPVIAFARTAAHDTEVGDCPVRQGDRLALLYPAANRDESTFDRPDDFLVDRSPNPHLAFGIGEHYCLGARLARLELGVFIDVLVARVRAIEVTGPVERFRSSLLSGVEHLPVRYRLAPRT